jgi:predicted ATPase/DNA-binding SARP family transcriptional activator
MERLALLGGFEVGVAGEPVAAFDTDKTRALLAYLAVEGGQPQSRETLAGLLWPEMADDAARRNLRHALFKLRQALGEEDDGPGWLLITAKTVQLDPTAAVMVDVTAFSDLLAACRAHRHRHPARCVTCHQRLAQAAAWYRGDLLRGFYLPGCAAFEEWLLLQRERLHRQAVQILSSLAAYHAERGEDGPALDYLYRQVELEPWREEAHQQAMRLLARSGQRSAALAQYEICRRILAEELHAAPSAETTALYEQIKAHAPDDAPPAPAAPAPPPNLPRQLTPFIGREEELRLLVERLDSLDCGLLTVIGPGGVGKTRLAGQAAGAQVGAFRDGVYWVALAAITDPALLPATIGAEVGGHFERGVDPAAQLLHHLREKELLLVLDNFEQLQGGPASDLLSAILQHAPHVSLLVTSRERLGLQAEFLLDLAGLPLPALAEAAPGPAPGPAVPADPATLLESSAVRLFVERARQAHPAFALSSETVAGVVEICHLVAGLPLGIVLAAAWVRHLPPARIAAAIRANLDFLASTARDAPPQHSSLRAVFEHSWQLLSEDERRAFRGLGVFCSGWDAEAAEAVAGAGLPLLLSLVDKSLLRAVAAERFDVHEVLRQYAREKLAEGPTEYEQVARRHAEYYLDLAEQGEGGLRGGEQATWLVRLERDHDNLRAALQWAIDRREAILGLRLGGALWRFWYVRGYINEGRMRLAAVLAIAPRADTAADALLLAARAKVLHGAGGLASEQGDLQAGRAFYEQSLALRRQIGDQQGIATTLNNLGLLVHEQGDYETARALHEESLALRRELQDKGGQASSLNNLGIVAYHQGDYAAAQALYEESLALRRELDDQRSIALLLSNLGIVAQSCGDYAAARTLHEESLALMRALGDQHGIATALTSLGIVAQNQEQYAIAHALHQESLALNRALGNKPRIALDLYNLGVVAQAGGDYAAARQLYQESLALRQEVGERWGIAATLNSLGWLAQTVADYAGARALHQESLALYHELGALRGVAASLAGLGGVAVGRATPESASHLRAEYDPALLVTAARLFGVVAGLLERLDGVLDIEDRQPYERNVAAVQALLGADAFAHAWAAGRAMPLDQALAEALPEGPGGATPAAR